MKASDPGRGTGPSLAYSVAIRSVGNNEYLKKTLHSLRAQSLRPAEVLIVIPFDADPWTVDALEVRFLKAPRGMVTQRAAGITGARYSPVILIDDDIELAGDALERLLEPMKRRGAVCVVPYWPEGYPKKGIRRRIQHLAGIAVPRKEGGISYNAGGGYLYPLREPPGDGWETCGGAGALIAIDREFALAKNATGDPDLQKISAYALREDGALILSWHLEGGKCLMVPGVNFLHLGGTTRLSADRLYLDYKSHVYNQILFWRKYIHPMYRHGTASGLRARGGLVRYLAGIVLLAAAASARNLSLKPLAGIVAGFFPQGARGER